MSRISIMGAKGTFAKISKETKAVEAGYEPRKCVYPAQVKDHVLEKRCGLWIP